MCEEHIRTLHNSRCASEKQVATLALSHLPVVRQSRTALTYSVNSGRASQGHCKEATPPAIVLGHVQVMPSCTTSTLPQYPTTSKTREDSVITYYSTQNKITQTSRLNTPTPLVLIFLEGG